MNTSTPKYLLAQYFKDPLRREARNIGVLVQKDGKTSSRFLGELDGGAIDGRKLRKAWMPETSIYKHWVDHWREELEELGASALESLMRSNESNYILLPGGTVDGTNSDSADQVCDYLFRLLVAGGDGGSESDDEEDAPVKILKNEMKKAFRDRGILADVAGDRIHHPVLADVPVAGDTITHTPAFVQTNGRLWIMEPVNLTTHSRPEVKKQVYYAAKMFDDIRAKTPEVETIPVVQSPEPGEADGELIENLLHMLMRSSNGRLVKWNQEPARLALLDDRENTALQNGAPRDRQAEF